MKEAPKIYWSTILNNIPPPQAKLPESKGELWRLYGKLRRRFEKVGLEIPDIVAANKVVSEDLTGTLESILADECKTLTRRLYELVKERQ